MDGVVLQVTRFKLTFYGLILLKYIAHSKGSEGRFLQEQACLHYWTICYQIGMKFGQ